MSRAPEQPIDESRGPRPRLGDLLLGLGLLTTEQLDEGLARARSTGKPLGQVLVEEGLVASHSIAMALADQHGGPLKTEFGFATGRSPAVSAPARAGAETRPDELRARAAELEHANAEGLATIAALREELAALRETRQTDAKAIAAWRVQLDSAQSHADEAARAAATLQAELDENRAELAANRAAGDDVREPPGARHFSTTRHFLFAPGATGYALLEVPGPAPAPGDVVVLADGRDCRVQLVGPTPWPGADEACAYLALL